MDKTLKLYTYKGKETFFTVENVEDILCLFTYTVTGDECAAVVYTNGDLVVLDSDPEERFMDFGPEDMSVLLPEDVQWEHDAYAA